MKEGFPAATRAEYLSGDVTPRTRLTLRRTRLDFGDVGDLASFNDAGIIDDILNPLPEGDAYVGMFDKSTGGAPVSQSITDVGFKPTFLMLWCTRQTNIDTLSTYDFGTIGTACQDSDDTIYQQVYAWQSEDNQSFADTDMTACATEVFRCLDTSGNVIVNGTLTSFDASGFTITWTVNDANAYKIGYVAIKAPDYTATRQKIMTWESQASTGTQQVTGLGFQPGFLLNMGGGTTAMPGTRQTYYVGVGAADENLNQFGSGIASLNGATGSWGHFVQDAAQFHYMPNSAVTPTIRNRFDLDSLDSDGFTVDHTINAGFTYKHNVMAFKDWPYIYVGEFTLPGASGDIAVTNVGFQPDAVIFLQNAYADGPGVGGPANLGMGAMDYNGNQGCFNTYDQRVSPSDTERYITASYCALTQFAGGSIRSYLEYKSMDSNGFTVTFTRGASEHARQLKFIAFKVTT